jgi:hypothetical protein
VTKKMPHLLRRRFTWASCIRLHDGGWLCRLLDWRKASPCPRSSRLAVCCSTRQRF